METLPDELSTFCHNTSVKGIPRIIKSKSLVIKSTWSIAILLFFGLAVSQVVLLVSEYFEWNVVVDFRDELMVPLEVNTLPKISLCNQQPIAGASQSNASAYYKHAYNITQCDDQCTDEEKALMADVQAQLLKPSGYFQFLDKNQAEAVSQTAESFIRECKLILIHGTSTVQLPCEGAGVEVETPLNPDYFRCFSITAPRKHRERIVIGLSLVLFLDNPYITDSYYGADGGGAVLIPHYDVGVPNPFLEGMFLASGQHTVLQADRHEVIRLPEPYGPCVHSSVTHREFTWRNISNCFVNMTRKYCNCTDVQHATFEEPYDVDIYPYCGDARFGIDWLKQKTQCVGQRNAEVCATESRLPCIEHQYPVDTSLIAWPALNQGFENFYDDYIQGKAGSDMLEPVHRYIEKNCSGDIACGLLEQQADSLIRSNFLKFSFFLRGNYYSVTEEQPKIELLELLSQCGSILNLWSGITMIVLVEVLEVCYSFMRRLCSAEHPHAPGDRTMTERSKESIT